MIKTTKEQRVWFRAALSDLTRYREQPVFLDLSSFEMTIFGVATKWDEVDTGELTCLESFQLELHSGERGLIYCELFVDFLSEQYKAAMREEYYEIAGNINTVLSALSNVLSMIILEAVN